MPVATQASLKGLTPEQLEETGCRLCLNNTYHLGLKPGQAVLDAIGGAHRLQGWNYNILTDSGGLVWSIFSVLRYALLTCSKIPNGLVIEAGHHYGGRCQVPESSRWHSYVSRLTPKQFL